MANFQPFRDVFIFCQMGVYLNPAVTLRNAAKMEEIVVNAGISLEQVHHGYDMAYWAVNERALERGTVSIRDWRILLFCRTGRPLKVMQSW